MFIRKEKGDDLVVSQKYPHESFHGPRYFLKFPDDIHPSVVTIAEQDSIVAFTPNASGHYEKYIELGTGVHAVIKPRREGHLMFYKIWKPGIVRGPDIPHGNLTYAGLKADLKPTQNTGALFDGKNIFEFDVSVYNDKYIIIATSDKGFVFVSGSFSDDQGFKWQVLAEKNNENDFISPSVIAFNDRIYLALIEILPDGKQRILTNSISITDWE